MVSTLTHPSDDKQSVWLPPTVALIGVLIVSALFWPTLYSMAQIWERSETFAHGYVIAPISIFLIWRMRDELAYLTPKVCWFALVPLTGLAAMWVIARLVDVTVVQQFCVVLMLACVVWLVLGTQYLKALWFPLAFLLLAVPFGEGLIPFLIERTADFVVFALKLSGLPVYRDGNLLMIPSGTWSVVSGCSGMRYLMATITVGTLFAYLNYHSWWRRVLFVVIAIAVAIVANWLRAYGIVMIAHLSGMKLALGVDHYIYGWVFFGIVIFLLMGIGSIWTEHPEPVQGKMPDNSVSTTPVSTLQLATALTAILLIAGAAPWFADKAFANSSRLARTLKFDTFMHGSAWSPTAATLLAWQPEFQNPTQTHRQGFYNAQHGRVSMYIAWYAEQGQGAEITSAANRLTWEKHERWRVKNTHIEPVAGMSPTEVRESTFIERATGREHLMWQWYWVNGRDSALKHVAKRAELMGLLRQQGNAGAIVLLYTEIDGIQTVDAARKRLRAFLGDATGELETLFSPTSVR